MPNHYYGTKATLAWIFGHYFFNAEHYTWLASEFFPYRLPNPKSSNPYQIYADLYQPWKDRDDFDKYIQQVRLNIRKGVIAQEKAGVISADVANRLREICDRVDIVFLYPIVCRVDIDSIDSSRRQISGSGVTAGSSEELITDLRENEFDILFLDFEADASFRELVVDEVAASGTFSRAPLPALEESC
jgi:hypothetical protein